ncbi:thioredoxin-like protein [Circinella umbellata]|nr:thioredoxin-like protein [Circinella umbellata]
MYFLYYFFLHIYQKMFGVFYPSDLDNKVVLYTKSTSPYGHRVRMALKVVNIDYELVIVDMNDREWYKKEIYPEGKVPALKYGQEVIPESMVIVELLHDLYPTAKLFTTADPVRKAKMKFAIGLFEDRVLSANRKLLDTRPITRESFDVYVETISSLYRRFNGLLLEQSSSGPYFLGSQYSAVDIALAPFVFQVSTFAKLLTGKNFKVLDDLPRLRTFLDSIVNHPVCQETGTLDEERFSNVAIERFGVTRNMFVK